MLSEKTKNSKNTIVSKKFFILVLYSVSKLLMEKDLWEKAFKDKKTNKNA